MRTIPAIPKNYTYRTVVALCAECDNGIGVCYNIPTLEEFAERLRYKSAYCYGDIIALADRHEHCTGFSHWSQVSGSNEMRPVWHWSESYTILERFRVGRGGRFVPLSSGQYKGT